MSSASLNENRLTAEDRQRIRTRLTEVIGEWKRLTPGRNIGTSVDLLSLQRIGSHAIGCGTFDLRDSELDEIDSIVDEIVA